jgi:hypothetical protein
MNEAKKIWREVEREAWEPAAMPREVFEALLHLFCAREKRCLMAETELGEFGALLVGRCNENGRCHVLPGQPKVEQAEASGAQDKADIERLIDLHREYGLDLKHLGGGRFALMGGEDESGEG